MQQRWSIRNTILTLLQLIFLTVPLNEITIEGTAIL